MVSRRSGIAPSTFRWESCSTSRHASAAAAFAAPPAMAILASSMPRPMHRSAAWIRRSSTDASGRKVSGVEVQRNGQRESYTADIVVVACGAINSAALLLRSANDRHPHGLANGSGQVGRNYMCHLNSVLLAVSRCPNPTVFQKTLALNDFYYESKAWDHPMGHVSFIGKTDGHVLAAGAPKIVPGFTLEIMAKHSLDFWLT